MTQSSTELIYSVDQKPPFWTTLLLGLQHTVSMSSTLVLPILIFAAAAHGFTAFSEIKFVQASMFAAGIGSILMGIKRKYFGAGYLAPLLCEPALFTASLNAVQVGGLPLLYGMTFLAGLFQTFLGTIFQRLRAFFPTEVTGVVVLMIGIILVAPGISNAVGDASVQTLQWHTNDFIVSASTLAVMVGLTIWGRRLRLYCLLIGIAMGYLLAYFERLIPSHHLHKLHDSQIIAWPFSASFLHLQFNAALLLPFLVAAISNSLKSAGGMITCQKINEKRWVKVDINKVKRGIFTTGLSMIFSSLTGGMATGVATNNIGLSVATSVTSRFVGIMAGIIFCVLAFFPKLALVFVIMPKPVIGAILLYVTTFVIVAGIQILTSRALDNRRIFVIGFSLIAGISAEIVPEAFTQLPLAFHAIFDSPLTVATLAAIILNLVFRIGDKSVVE